MKHILLTGATGFVGSALAATFLASSAKIVALTRADPSGDRTRTAVRTAAEGFGINLSDTVLRRNLRVVEVDAHGFAPSLQASHLATITDVWHVAADMNLSTKKLAQTFATNVGMTTQLYQHVAALALKCKRFYYVSTAYAVGMDGGEVHEELHFGGNCINPYQVSKRCAEHSLALLSTGSRLPVTIFRPTIVVGHCSTGWTVRNGFGLYMFAEALKLVTASSQTSFNMSLIRTSRPDLLPVDQLVEEAFALTMRKEIVSGLEIFHCTGGRGMSLGDMVIEIGRLCGIAVTFAHPETELESTIAAAMEPRMPFANTDWQFDRSKLDKTIGLSRTAPSIGHLELGRLMRWYLAETRSN